MIQSHGFRAVPIHPQLPQTREQYRLYFSRITQILKPTSLTWLTSNARFVPKAETAKFDSDTTDVAYGSPDDSTTLNKSKDGKQKF
jgi:hypothetical protein